MTATCLLGLHQEGKRAGFSSPRQKMELNLHLVSCIFLKNPEKLWLLSPCVTGEHYSFFSYSGFVCLALKANKSTHLKPFNAAGLNLLFKFRWVEILVLLIIIH